MLNITFVNKTSTVLDEEKIVDVVRKVFIKHGFSENVEASIAIVHHSEVVKLAMLYMKETEKEAQEHPVLSFLTSEIEHEFIFPPDGINHLGEVIVSFEMSSLRDKAPEELKDKTVDERLAYWAAHGALHLVGVHHD